MNLYDLIATNYILYELIASTDILYDLIATTYILYELINCCYQHTSKCCNQLRQKAARHFVQTLALEAKSI